MQEALKEALSEFNKAKNEEEIRFLEKQVTELKERSDHMVIILKVSSDLF